MTAKMLAAILGAIVAVEALLQFLERVKNWHQLSASQNRRVALYCILALIIGIVFYVQQAATNEHRTPSSPNDASNHTVSPEITTTSATSGEPGSRRTQPASATTGTFTSAATITNTVTDDRGPTAAPSLTNATNQSPWERLNRGLILAAKQKPADFEETVGPDA